MSDIEQKVKELRRGIQKLQRDLEIVDIKLSELEGELSEIVRLKNTLLSLDTNKSNML